MSFLSRTYSRRSSRLGTGPDSHRLPVDLGAATGASPPDEPTQARPRALESLGPPSASPRPTASLSVLVADDAPGTLQALVELLDDTPDISCVAAVDDAQAAISAAAHYQPDVALLDVRMPEGGGLGAALGIREVSPRTKLLAYSAASDRGSVVQMLRSGALGYVIKGTPATQLLNALRRCAAGETVLSEGLSGHLVTEMIEQGRTERLFAAAAQARYERVSQLLEPGATAPSYQPIVCLQTGEVVGYEALAHFSSQPLARTEEVFAEAHKVGLGAELELHAAMLAVDGFALELQSSDSTWPEK
ncbi:MAG: response regulator [Acidimicrobiales bacterium]